MKLIIKLLSLVITIISILVLSSCTSRIIEEEVKTVPERESSVQPSQTIIEAPLITIDELLGLIESDANIIIVDLRGESSYQQAHIKGAVNVLPSVIGAGEWEPPNGYTIILY